MHEDWEDILFKAIERIKNDLASHSEQISATNREWTKVLIDSALSPIKDRLLEMNITREEVEKMIDDVVDDVARGRTHTEELKDSIVDVIRYYNKEHKIKLGS